ncbi:MAG: FtsQ-type POTRA domain-containing protein [bacterium]
MKKHWRRERKKRSGFFLKLFLFLLAAFGAFIGLRFLWDFVTNWDKLNVRKIDIRGIKVLKQEQIRALVNFKEGRNIFSYSIDPLIFDKEKWLKSVKVVRDFPDRVVVQVEERFPLASFRKGSANFIVTFDNVIVECLPEAEKIYKIPEWRDFASEGREQRNKITQFLKELKIREIEFYEKVDSISLEDGLLKFGLKDFMIYFGRPDVSEISEKLESVRAVLRDAAAKNKEVEYLDLRPFTKKMQSAIIKFKKGMKK